MTNKEFAEFLIAKIDHHRHKLCDGKSDPITDTYAQAHTHIIELIKILTPSKEETAAPTTYWIGKKVDKSHYHYFCSHCHYRSKFVKTKFCPACGRLMNEENKE